MSEPPWSTKGVHTVTYKEGAHPVTVDGVEWREIGSMNGWAIYQDAFGHKVVLETDIPMGKEWQIRHAMQGVKR